MKAATPVALVWAYHQWKNGDAREGEQGTSPVADRHYESVLKFGQTIKHTISLSQEPLERSFTSVLTKPCPLRVSLHNRHLIPHFEH